MTESSLGVSSAATRAEAVIIGGGPAGLTAAVYLSRAMVNLVLIEKKVLGGNALKASEIENYPGFEKISGPDLVDHMVRQVRKYAPPIIYATVLGLVSEPDAIRVRASGSTITAKTVIIAVGTAYRRLGVPGEAEYLGKGVSFCAACDGMFYRDKVIAMVGGGDSALKELVYLAKLARKVYLIHRREDFRAEWVVQEQVRQLKNVEFVLGNTVREIKGDAKVKSVVISRVGTEGESQLEIDGLFINVGNTPETGFVKGFLELDEHGYVVTDRELRTSVRGIFAAGDARVSEQRQIATAVGDGALAAAMVEKFLGRR